MKVRIDPELFDTLAWRQLSDAARALFFEAVGSARGGRMPTADDLSASLFTFRAAPLAELIDKSMLHKARDGRLKLMTSFVALEDGASRTAAWRERQREKAIQEEEAAERDEAKEAAGAPVEAPQTAPAPARRKREPMPPKVKRMSTLPPAAPLEAIRAIYHKHIHYAPRISVLEGDPKRVAGVRKLWDLALQSAAPGTAPIEERALDWLEWDYFARAATLDLTRNGFFDKETGKYSTKFIKFDYFINPAKFSIVLEFDPDPKLQQQHEQYLESLEHADGEPESDLTPQPRSAPAPIPAVAATRVSTAPVAAAQAAPRVVSGNFGLMRAGR